MYFDGFPNPNGPVDVQVFTGNASVTQLEWRTWRKPAGKSMAWMFCIGGGGGGGGGFTGTAATDRGGGGGGGGSSQATLIIPLIHLPDSLAIQCGIGGAGVGSGGGTAGSGVVSKIAIQASVSATPVENVLLLSGNAAAAGGGTGTGAAVGAAGVAGTISTIGNMPLAQLGQYTLIAGQAGAAGGAIAGAVGSPIAIPVTGVRCMGGPGGAGAGNVSASDFAGGLITLGATGSYLSERCPAVPVTGVASSGGYMMWKPLWSWCGTGGSSSDAAAGQNGGNSAYGSGGAGGGAGTTGGTGGRGGDGLVIIVSW